VSQAQLPPELQLQPLSSQEQSSQLHAVPQHEHGSPSAGPLTASAANGATMRSPTRARPSSVFLNMVSSKLVREFLSYSGSSSRIIPARRTTCPVVCSRRSVDDRHGCAGQRTRSARDLPDRPVTTRLQHRLVVSCRSARRRSPKDDRSKCRTTPSHPIRHRSTTRS